MNGIFGELKKIDPSQCTCHSGGASGSDSEWAKNLSLYGGITKAYSYKTKYHNSSDKVEISDEDYQDGVKEIHKANQYMKRQGIGKYMNLLARNWAQVKYSQQLFAIGNLVRIGAYNNKGYCNKGKCTIVDGGTGFGVMMAILNKRLVFVFDQMETQWYKWSYNINDYVKVDKDNVYIVHKDFAGIGTRNINDQGIDAIKYVFTNSEIS